MANDALHDRWMPRTGVIQRRQKVAEELQIERRQEPRELRKDGETPEAMRGALRLR
jgi:hypothetical protein